MKTTHLRKPKWPKHITLENITVTIYRRITPNGKTGFMLAYKQDGRRKFDSYPDETTAIQEANTKARQLSALGVKAAQLTGDELCACVAAMDAVKPLGITIGRAVDKFLEAVEVVGDVAKVTEACRFCAARNKRITHKPVADVVAELLSIKGSRGASVRYMQTLRNRLGRFAEAFHKDMDTVVTADIQAWLDGRKLSPGNYGAYRRIVHLLFEFGAARGYCIDNPVDKVERVKVNGGNTEIFTPSEIAKLLGAAASEFVPCIALGAFCGLRSAEIERLEWSDVDLVNRQITVGAKKAKTASRRIVPISDNLLEWLTPHAGQQGHIWKGGHDAFYNMQQLTAKAAGVKWKQNALRHSAASYMFALSNDAGRVAGFLGNSESIMHKHYRELVKPSDAVKWFEVKPECPSSNLMMNTSANS